MRIKSYLVVMSLASLFLAAFLPLDVLAQTDSVEWIKGQQWVENIDKGYQAGRYQSIFKQIDDIYQQRKQEGVWQSLRQQETHLLGKFKISEEELKERSSLFKEKIEHLKKETNEKLLDIAHAYPQDPVSKIIEVYLDVPKISPEQKKILASLGGELLYSKQPPDSPLLKQFQEVVFEYHFKRIVVQTKELSEVKQKIEGSSASKEAEEVALNLQKFDRLEQLAREQNETALVQTVQQGRQAYLLQAAYHHNQRYLANLGRKKTESRSEAEKKVSQVMHAYREKTLALMKEYRFLP